LQRAPTRSAGEHRATTVGYSGTPLWKKLGYRDGMVAFSGKHKPVDIPISGSDQVTDVTGAGDSVIATFTAALAAGASAEEAAHLANYAGGIVVMKSGTATVTQSELLAAIEQCPPAVRAH